jgi:hypothetical protein
MICGMSDNREESDNQDMQMLCGMSDNHEESDNRRARYVAQVVG